MLRYNEKTQNPGMKVVFPQINFIAVLRGYECYIHRLVFAREDGQPLALDVVTKKFRKLAKAAGVRGVRLHDLCHGAASLRLASGTDIAVVSKLLGHSSIAITNDTYSHLLPGVGKAAAERASALVPRNRRDQSVATNAETAGDAAAPSTVSAGSESAPPGTRTPNPRIKRVRQSRVLGHICLPGRLSVTALS
jgi:Phage integrase family